MDDVPMGGNGASVEISRLPERNGSRSSWLPGLAHVTCERVVLMQIIRGDLAPEMALAMGQVDVDDLGQLMAFKMAFKLERELFDAYLTKVGVK